MGSPLPLPLVDYLLLGHVSKDLVPEGHRLGGAVAYSGCTARAMGLTVGVVTADAGDIDLSPLVGLHLHTLPSPETTSFENVYTESGRRQRLAARARPLQPTDVPQPWSEARCVHLAPIADELPLDTGRSFPAATLFSSPQGWLRQWDADGRIHLHPWQRLLPALSGLQAAVLGWEDIGGEAQAAQALAEAIPILVLTCGPFGADLYLGGSPVHIDAPPARQVDPTGAGDVFAAAFFVGLLRGDDPLPAAQRAAAIAALSVEAAGLAGVPSTAQILSLESGLR